MGTAEVASAAHSCVGMHACWLEVLKNLCQTHATTLATIERRIARRMNRVLSHSVCLAAALEGSTARYYYRNNTSGMRHSMS